MQFLYGWAANQQLHLRCPFGQVREAAHAPRRSVTYPCLHGAARYTLLATYPCQALHRTGSSQVVTYPFLVWRCAVHAPRKLLPILVGRCAVHAPRRCVTYPCLALPSIRSRKLSPYFVHVALRGSLLADLLPARHMLLADQHLSLYGAARVVLLSWQRPPACCKIGSHSKRTGYPGVTLR